MGRVCIWLGLMMVAFPIWGAEEGKPASPDAGPKITYDEHVRPILREHCFACHALDRAKGGLTLDTYAKTMTGGSSGEVVLAGDLDSSRLWALVSHQEEPVMPPMQDKLADAKLDLIKKWIEQGALENAGSKVVLKKKPSLALSAPTNIGKPEGPAAMPENVLCQPVVHTTRTGQITTLATSPWAPIVAIGGQKQVLLYNTDNGNLMGVLPFPEGIPYVVRFSRNGSILLVGGGRGGHSGSVVLYDVKTGNRLTKLGEELDAVLAADISPNLQQVAMSGPGKIIRVYDVASGQLEHEIKKHTDWVYGCEFSPDGVLLATCDRSAGLFVWEAESGQEYLDLRGHSSGVSDVAWRGDSNMLASAGEDGTVRLWELQDGKQVKQWNAHGGGVACVSYAHDGKLCTAGRDNSVKSWTADGAAIKTYPGFAEQALQSVFSHDGNRVVGGDWLGNVKIWETADAKEVLTLSANPVYLEDQLAQAKERMGAAQGPLNQAKEALAQAEKALAEKLAAAQATAEKAKQAAAEPAKAEAALATAKKDAETNAATLKQANDQLAALQEQLKSLGDAEDKGEEKAAKEKEIAAAQQGAEQAQNKVNEANKLVETLAASLKAAQDAVAPTAAEAAQKEKERAEAEKQVAEKRPVVEQAQATLNVIQAEVQRLEGQVAHFQQLPTQLATAVAAAEQKLPPLKETRDKLAAERDAVMSEMTAKESAMAELNAKVAELQAELAKLAEAKKGVAEKVAAKEGELTQAETALAEAEANVSTASAAKKTFEEAYGSK